MAPKQKLTMHLAPFDMLPTEIVSLIQVLRNVSILAIGTDPYEQSKLLGEQLRIELALPICRIPMSVSEYEIANFIQKEKNRAVFVLSDVSRRSTVFFASLFASLSKTDHLVVIGAESYDQLQHFANRFSIVCDDNLREVITPSNESIKQMQGLIASSSIDRIIIRAERLNVSIDNIFQFILLPHLLLRDIIPSSPNRGIKNNVEMQKNDLSEEQESMPKTNSPKEQILDGLNIKYSIQEQGQKKYRSTRFSNGHFRTNNIAKVGRTVNHSRVRAAKYGHFSLYHTILASAPFQKQRSLSSVNMQAVYLEPDDIRRYPYKALSKVLTIIILDSSGSMAASSRIRFAKGFVQTILKHSYQTRRYAALIVARGAEAKLVAAPTRSVSKISSALKILPTGGGTPIASALEKAIELSMFSRRRHQDLKVEIALITDGKVNVNRNKNSDLFNDLQLLGNICVSQKIDLKIADITKQSEAAMTLAKTLGGDYRFYSNDLHTSHIA